MSRVLGDLLLRIGADLASFNQLRGQLDSTTNSIAEFAAKAETLSLNFERAFTGPIEKAGEALLKLGEDFHEATNTIIRQTGAVGDQLQSLQGSFNNVFGSVDESAAEVSNAIGQLSTKFGVTGKELEDLTKSMLDFHDAVGGDTTQTINATIQLFGQWAVATADQTAKMTELMRVSQAAAVPVQKIEELMTQFGPALREAGIGFDQAALMIGNLAKAGVNVEPTLQGISKALATMTKAGLTDPLEGLQLLAEKIKNAATEGEAFAIGATAFGKGAASMVSAIREGRLSFEDFAGSLQLGTREIGETAEQVKTLGEKWDEFWKKLKLAFAPIADDLVKAIEQLLKAAQPLLDWVADLAKKFSELSPETKNLIFGFLGLVAAIGPIAGIIAGAAFAFETLMGVLGAAAGILSPILVPALIAVGAAIAGWAIYKAVTQVNQLETGIRSLEDALAHGKAATDDQASSIAVLESAIAKYNAQISNKVKIEVPKFAPSGEAVLPAQYIQNMQAAINAAGGMAKVAGTEFGKFTGELFDSTGKLNKFTLAVDELGTSTDTAGKKAKGFGANTKAAVDKVLEAFGPMKQVEEQIKKFQEIVGAQSLPMKQLQLSDLQRRALAPTKQDADTLWAEYYSEVVKLNRAASIQTADETLAALAEVRHRLKTEGMDTEQAFATLGVMPTAEIERQADLLNVAFAKLTEGVLVSSNDVQRALIANAQKLVDLWRSTGQKIRDEDILTLDRLKADWEAATLDIGQAFQKLGVSSETQIGQQLQIVDAALAKIRASVAAGKATQIDADNAEIASLEKKAAAFAALGKQITDEEVSQLNRLKTARQASAMTTEGAFAFLGLPSKDDLDNSLKLITTAFEKIAKAETTTATQLNAARAAELGKMIDAYRKAGVQVTADMLDEWKKRTAEAQVAALDIDQAFKKLGVLSTRDARSELDLLDAAFQKISASADSTGTQIQAALVNKLRATVDALKKSGGEITESLLLQLHEAETAFKEMTMNLDDAFSQLGVQSTRAIVDAARLAKAALDEIKNSESATFADRLQAQIRYNEDVYKSQVMLGQKTDEFQAAQTALAKQRLQAALSDQYNIYLSFAKTVAEIYGQVQSSIVDVIMGAKSLGQAFEDIGKTIEKALLNYVVKNLLLTQDTLDKLTDSLLGLLKELTGAFTGGGGLPGLPGGGGGGEPGGGTGGTTSGVGGVLGQLSNLTNVLGLVVNIISSIVQAIQGARMISALGKIEENTRRMDIILEQSDGVLYWVKQTGMATAVIRDEIQGTLHQSLTDISSNLDGIAANSNDSLPLLKQITALFQKFYEAGWGRGGSFTPDGALQLLANIEGVLRDIKIDTLGMVYALGQLVMMASTAAANNSDQGAGDAQEGAAQAAQDFSEQVGKATSMTAKATSALGELGDTATGLMPTVYDTGVALTDLSKSTDDAKAQMNAAAEAAFNLQLQMEAAANASRRIEIGSTESTRKLQTQMDAAATAAFKLQLELAQAAEAARRMVIYSNGLKSPDQVKADAEATAAFNRQLEEDAKQPTATGYIVPYRSPGAAQAGSTVGQGLGLGLTDGWVPSNEVNYGAAAQNLLSLIEGTLSAPETASFLNSAPAGPGQEQPVPYGVTEVPNSVTPEPTSAVLQSNVSGIILDDEGLRKLTTMVFDQFNEMQRQAGLLR